MIRRVFKRVLKGEMEEDETLLQTIFIEHLNAEVVGYYSKAFHSAPHKKSAKEIFFYPEEVIEEFSLQMGEESKNQKIYLTFTEPHAAREVYDFFTSDGGKPIDTQPLTCQDRYGIQWTLDLEESEIYPPAINNKEVK